MFTVYVTNFPGMIRFELSLLVSPGGLAISIDFSADISGYVLSGAD